MDHRDGCNEEGPVRRPVIKGPNILGLNDCVTGHLQKGAIPPFLSFRENDTPHILTESFPS